LFSFYIVEKIEILLNNISLTMSSSCEQLSKSYMFEGVEFFPTAFKDGMRLQAKQLETTETEFKGLGKIIKRNKLSPYENWDDFKHQEPELEMQIAAMLNTNGGKIFFGVAKNAVIKGGDYTYEDKENLLCFLKNLAKKLGIAGHGLIQEPKFLDIPYEFVSTLPNAEGATRYLVVLNIKPAREPVYVAKKLYVRDLGGVEEVNYETWFNRRYPSYEEKPIPKQTKGVLSGRPRTYAQVVS